MFEAENQNQNSLQPERPAPVQSGGVEDIFAATDAQGSAPQAALQPSLVIPGPPTALASGKIRVTPTTNAGIPAGQMASAGSGFPFKKMLIIFLTSAVVIGGAVVAFIVLQNRATVAIPEPGLGAPQDTGVPAAPPSESASQNTAPSNASASEAQDTGGILKNFQQDSIDRALNPIPQDPASIDTDQDGLSDAQEFGHGTNPRLVDSDSDGLSDWEEIAIFGTDPLNRDSDGDGYVDGEEVQNGYNPLGPGKLLDIEQTNQESQ